MEDLSAQDILGPKEDLLAVLERMPKSVTIEAAAQTKSKASGKASLPELCQAGKVLLQGPSQVFLQDKTELPVPYQRSGQSVVQKSSKTEAVRKVTIQTQSKDSTPVRSAGLAPNKLLVSGIVSSPTLSESSIPIKTVSPTVSKNANLGVLAGSPSASKAAAEAKAAIPSQSQSAASTRAIESAQIQAGATVKATILEPNNKTKTCVGSPLALQRGTASDKTFMPTQSEAGIQGRVAAWTPNKDMSLSMSTSSALQEGYNQVKTVAPVPSIAVVQRSEGQVPVKVSETGQSKNTPNKGLIFGKYAEPAIDKIAFQGRGVPLTASEAALPVKDALPTFHKDSCPVAVPAPGPSISSVFRKESVKTSIDAQDKNSKEVVTTFTLLRQEPPLVPGKDLALGVDIAPTSSKDAFLHALKIDSGLGKAVELPTSAVGASGRPSILSQSKSPVSIKDTVTSRDRDIEFGVAAAKAPIKVTFSPLTIQSDKTSHCKEEEPVLVKAVESRMEPTPAKVALPTNTEFSGKDKFVSPSRSVSQTFVEDIVRMTEFSVGSKPPSAVKAVPTLRKDAGSEAAPTPTSNIGSTIGRNTTSSTNEALDVRGELPAIGKFEVVCQTGPSRPGEYYAPITDTLSEKSKETKQCASERKASLPESSKFLFPHQVVLPPPNEDQSIGKDSVQQCGRDAFFGVRAKTPIRVSFSGLAEPLEQGKETVPVRATYSEEDLRSAGSALYFGIKQGKEVPERRDIPKTLSETKCLVPVEGTISADLSERPVSVKATTPSYPVLSENKIADLGKITSPVATKSDTFGPAAPSKQSVKSVDSVNAIQPTTEDLFTEKSAVLPSAVTPQDQKASSALDVLDQEPNKSDVATDKTIQNESLAHNKVLVKNRTEVLAGSQGFIPEPGKDYAPVELSLESRDVLPESSELLALGATTVAAAVAAEEGFDAFETTSALNNSTVQVETEKPTPGEDLSPLGAAFPGQNKGLASEALLICCFTIALKRTKT